MHDSAQNALVGAAAGVAAAVCTLPHLKLTSIANMPAGFDDTWLTCEMYQLFDAS